MGKPSTFVLANCVNYKCMRKRVSTLKAAKRKETFSQRSLSPMGKPSTFASANYGNYKGMLKG